MMRIFWILLIPCLLKSVVCPIDYKAQKDGFGWKNDRWDEVLDDMGRNPMIYTDEELMKLVARATSFHNAIPSDFLSLWRSFAQIDNKRLNLGWRFAPVLDKTHTCTIPGLRNQGQYRAFSHRSRGANAFVRWPWTAPQIDLIALEARESGYEPVALVRPVRTRLSDGHFRLSFRAIRNFDDIFGSGPRSRKPLYYEYLKEVKKGPKQHPYRTPQAFFEHALLTFQRRAGFAKDLAPIGAVAEDASSSNMIKAGEETKDLISQLAGSYEGPGSSPSSDAGDVARQTQDYLSQLASRPWRPPA